MWLQSAGICALHVLPDTCDTAGIHDIVGKSALFEEVLQMWTINCVGDDLRQFGAYVGAVAVTDRLNQQFSERPALELDFA